MKTTMTSRERIRATVKGEPTDHIPLSMEVHPSYLQYDPKIANWKNQFERTDFLLKYGTDPMTEVWLPDPCFHPDVKVTAGREENTSDGYVHLWTEYETPAGTLRQVICETDDLYAWHKINRNTCGPLADLLTGVGILEDANPSRHVQPLINGPEDLEKMKYLFNPPTGDDYAKWKEDAIYAKKKAEETHTTFLARRLHLGSAMLWLTDAQKTMCTYESDPDYVGKMFEIVEGWQLKLLDMVLDIGVDIVTRFAYYDTPDFWGIKYFERYLKDPMDKEAELCEQSGAFLSQQQSEGLTQQVEVYKKMKVHILREVDPVQGGEDLALLKRELGSTKTLMGGVNLDVWLANAEQAEIEGKIKETMDKLAPGGRFILHPIPGIYAGTPWEKIEMMVNAWKKHADAY
jgi:uroporphyrinogen-III decarboxylase